MKRCHICKRFMGKKPCDNDHNMQKYQERLDAQAEAGQDMMFEHAMSEAGGLDAIQERERRDYYVAKYGEY